MKKIFMHGLIAVGALLLAATEGFAFGSYGDNVNSLCAPSAPYIGDCTLCHTGGKGDPTPAKSAYLAGNGTLVDYFCPSGNACTDNDNDTFASEGGECGPVDCNDNDRSVNPGAAEVCTDSIDNDCDGKIDTADGNAVGCPPPCTDGDGDTFAVEGGNCGPVDCDDQDGAINPGASDIPNNGIDENCSGADSVDPTFLDRDGDGYTPDQGDCNDNNPAVNPGALDLPNNGIDEDCDGLESIDGSIVDNDGDGFSPANGDCDDSDAAINPAAAEICTDGLDNNCDGLIDALDPNAVECPAACTDNDLDTYAAEGGDCGPADCNDRNLEINPGAVELCGDSIDNDCDTLVDEGCDPACPDIDGDGYQDSACGGNDCDDTDAAINPGAAEVCGNEVDENCNGSGDEECQTCNDGTLLSIKKADYHPGKARLKVDGRAHVETTVTIADADTGEILAGGIAVKGGKWRTEIEGLAQAPERIRAINADGCFTDLEVKSKDKEHNGRDKDHRRDGEDEDSRRKSDRREKNHD
jgi:hypothetical protein